VHRDAVTPLAIEVLQGATHFLVQQPPLSRAQAPVQMLLEKGMGKGVPGQEAAVDWHLARFAHEPMPAFKLSRQRREHPALARAQHLRNHLSREGLSLHRGDRQQLPLLLVQSLHPR